MGIAARAVASLSLSFVMSVSAASPDRQSQSPSPSPSASVSSQGYDPPKALKTPQPHYSKDAYNHHLTGTVTLEFGVDVKGNVFNIRVVQSVAGLDDAAVDALKKWKFEPARQNGQVVAALGLRTSFAFQTD